MDTQNLKRYSSLLAIPVLALGTSALTGSTAQAQVVDELREMDQRPVDFEVRAGPSIPGDNLTEIVDVGFAVGGAADWWVNDRVALRLDGNVDLMPGNDVGAIDVQPDTRLFHYGGGILVDLMPAEMERWTLTTSLGAGAVTIDTDEFAQAAATEDNDFTETYFDVNAGLRLGYEATENLEVAVGGQSYVAFLDEEDTNVFAVDNPALDPFDTSVTFPITATLRWSMPN